MLRAKIKECDGLVSLLTDRIDGPLLDTAPRLKVVSNFAVGFNNIDVPAATERGVAVGNTPGVLTDATADMAMAKFVFRSLTREHPQPGDFLASANEVVAGEIAKWTPVAKRVMQAN